MVRNAQKMISRMFFIVGYFPHLGGGGGNKGGKGSLGSFLSFGGS